MMPCKGAAFRPEQGADMSVVESMGPAFQARPAGPRSAPRAEWSDTMSQASLPSSFGVFNPVGHVMLGLPTQQDAEALVLTFHHAGWPADGLLHFTPHETVAELAALIEQAGPLAGFGYEITLLRRYLSLAEQGYRWLLIKVDGVEQAAVVAAIAREGGADLAVHYRAWIVEELI